MEEQLITFETAKLAKEKGLCHYFEKINGTEYVPAFYSEDGVIFKEAEFQQEDCTIEDRYFRPTQSLLQKWIREKHNIHINVQFYDKELTKYEVVVYKSFNELVGHTTNKITNDCKSFTTYEEALESGLQEALKLI